jgi:hypothetical protein
MIPGARSGSTFSHGRRLAAEGEISRSRLLDTLLRPFRLAQMWPRGQVLNLRTGAIRMRLKDSIQSLRGALHAPLIYLPTVERGKIVPKMANLTLRTTPNYM